GAARPPQQVCHACRATAVEAAVLTKSTVSTAGALMPTSRTNWLLILGYILIEAGSSARANTTCTSGPKDLSTATRIQREFHSSPLHKEVSSAFRGLASAAFEFLDPQKSICNPSCKTLGAFSCELSRPNDCGDCRLTDGSAN